MTAGKTLRLAAPGYVDSHPEHLKNDLIQNLNVLLTTAETFNADLAVTQADKNLSPEGRNAAGVKVAAAALATLAAVEETTIKKLTDHVASIETSLLGKAAYVPPKDPAERVAHELHLQEIRSQLRELPAAERLNVYRSTTDPLVLAAIDTAPMMLSVVREDGTRRLEPFVDPAERIPAALARAAAADPVAANTLREVRSLQQVYTLAVSGLRKEICDDVPGATPEVAARILVPV